MNRTLLLVSVAAAAAGARDLSAQQAAPCGTAEISPAGVERIARYFHEEELAPVRADIPAVSPSAAREVVEEEAVCTAVRAALDAWVSYPQGYTYRVVRIGPYLAALVLANQETPGVVILGWAGLLVFREEDMAYLGAMLV